MLDTKESPATGNGGAKQAGHDDDCDHLNTEISPHKQDLALKRVHRRSGMSRSEERHRLTRLLAERQAEQVRAYWRHRGTIAHVWVEPIDGSTEWCVRSSLLLRAEPRP